MATPDVMVWFLYNKTNQMCKPIKIFESHDLTHTSWSRHEYMLELCWVYWRYAGETLEIPSYGGDVLELCKFSGDIVGDLLEIC